MPYPRGVFLYIFIQMPFLVVLILILFAGVNADDAGAVFPQFHDKSVTNNTRASMTQQNLFLEHTVDSNYVIGPGDFFEVLTPDGLDVVRVSPEGIVSLPGFGFVDVNGAPLFEAKKRIGDMLKTRFEERFFRIQLVQMRLLQVTILGAVSIPGRRAADPQSRLNFAFSNAGGLLPSADKRNIKLIRDTLTYIIDYTQFERGENDAMNITLETGDIIYVPFAKAESSISIESPEIRTSLPWVEGKTLGEYIHDAKITSEMNVKWARIKNPNGTTLVKELLPSYDLVPDPKTVIELWQDEPVVYVGGAVANMGKADFFPGLHAIDYIGASGVTIITGSWSRVTVIRDGKHFSVDPYKDEIKPGDYIEIPRSVYESVKDVTLFLASLLSVIATAIIITSY